MGPFRILLVVILVAIAGYTAVVAANHGMNLLPVFFGGALFLSTYLLIVTAKEHDARVVLLGPSRA